MSENTSNTKATGSTAKIQFDPKTRKPILPGSPKGIQREDFRASNAKLKGGPKNFMRRAGPRGG